MPMHRFKIGQFVSVMQSFPSRPLTGRIEIVRLMPAGVDGEFQYRVRDPDQMEHAVGERQLSPAFLTV